MTTKTDTVTQILDVAHRLMQARGYNAFSYADIAAEVGITKASIHYYFPSKSDLCRAVLHRHRLTLRTQLAQIDQQSGDPFRKLEQYMHLYADIQQIPELICIGGMLAADVQSLSNEVRAEVQGFFTDNEVWLTNVITQGVQAGVLSILGSPEDEAQSLIAGVQGALLIARSIGDSGRFHLIAHCLLERLLV